MCQFYTPSFIYYSYVSVLILSIITAFVILLKDKKHPINRNAFYFIMILALWMLFDLSQWMIHNAEINMFIGKIFVIIIFLFLFFLYFSYAFARIIIDLKTKLLFALPLVPILALMFTKYNIQYFNYSNCDYAYHPAMAFCLYFIALLYSIWSIIILRKHYKNPITPYQERSQTKVLILAISFFTLWGIFYEEIGRISLLNGSYIDITPHFVCGNLFFVSLIAFAIIKNDLFEFNEIPRTWLIITIWSFIFLLMLLFPMSVTSTIICASFYIILMIIFWKM